MAASNSKTADNMAPVPVFAQEIFETGELLAIARYHRTISLEEGDFSKRSEDANRDYLELR